MKKKILEQEFKNEGLFLEKAKKQYQRNIAEMENHYETSLPFDKKKEYEQLQKKEQERLNGMEVVNLMNQKQSQQMLQKMDEKQKHEEPFLDRLMVKNFKLYKNEYENRKRNQELSEDIYRNAHANDRSMGMISYEDEMKAKQHQDIQMDRQKYFENMLKQKNERNIN
mmetsp:Transcript_3938/g.3867  ORF Transcript_3938/g.3867 Transcript_3938/m.3867 type:complete len:168 (+) Transcript_3938:763-1266(+)|eukprot:CAMPEP_0170551940 /NCGR_PEP_ID=MMETSP0211-20121228/9925_1 /TAXON_ID=311385 /ORGANISM="Pseudokeronopsis sp., Strain OXSARD2" /LENGTH=167 /DNA_ID=CAMNT_0010859417 /DNA_START=732 /DNA_END=1235 /DNA_ORIENTATION=-